jgi:hypothetical protein
MANQPILPFNGSWASGVSLIDGLGWSNPCAVKINNELNSASEYDKWASAAATTITTLIPVLLSLQSLPTPNVRDLFLTGNNMVAAIVAGLTLGLPVTEYKHLQSFRDLSTEGVITEDEVCKQSEGHCYGLITPLSKIRQIVSSLCLIRRFQQAAPKSWLERAWVFFTVQLLLFVVLTIILFLLISPGWSLWSCALTGIWVTYGSVMVLIVTVGLVWIFSLRCLYQKSRERFGEIQVVFVLTKATRPLVSVVVNIGPGLSQSLVTILLMFLFSGLYGGTMKTALIRAAVIVGFLISSRGFCLFFSRRFIDANGDIFVTYEDNEHRETIRRWFEKASGYLSSVRSPQGIA